MNSIRYFLRFAAGLAIAVCLAVCAQAQKLNYFADFSDYNGWEPYASVTQGTNGYFYSSASGGVDGRGKIVRLIPGRSLSTLYAFCSRPNCADGAFPTTAPILGNDGNFYGVTAAGGTPGGGTVYRVNIAGKLTTLYNFCSLSACADGGTPNGIILASDGNFYGTTNYGGTAGIGTIFSVSSAGDYKTLYSFCAQTNCTDGSYPYLPPVQGTDGNFYGTTLSGGTTGGGVFYQLTAAGAYTVLYSFCNFENTTCPGGSNAYGVVQGLNGNFYGTTTAAGAHNQGTVFQITPTGQYSALYSFEYNDWLGSPQTLLTLGSDGNFYGTFNGGGSGSWAPKATGAIYRVTPAGEFTLLYTFCQCGEDGFTPLDSLFQATDGTFYGTTAYGGTGPHNGEDFGYGTLFNFSNGLSPLVETVPVAGKVGKRVIILGNNLTGSTSVTFNGVPAEFTVESDTDIKTTVPAGATTGTVSVVTQSGTLNSNPQFVVTK